MFTDVTASTSFFERHGDFDGLLLLREYNRVIFIGAETNLIGSVGPRRTKRRVLFVSTVTPHMDAQVRFLEGFSRRLFTIGVEPVFVREVFYDKKDPIGRVASQIASCKIVIVLGLERSHAYKELSKQESEGVHRKYTSSWLHLEAGLAYALGKQIFVLCSSDICSDGIFDRAFNTYHVHEFTEHSVFSDAMDTFFSVVSDWVRDSRDVKSAGGG